MLNFPCDPTCQTRRHSLYIVYGVILIGCVALALCHFILVYMKRRRIRVSIKEYQQRRESFAVLAASVSYPSPHEFSSDQDAFKISTDGSNELAIELPEDYPYPLLQNGVLENGGRCSFVSFTDHRNRPLTMQRRIIKTVPYNTSYSPGVGENIAEVDEDEDQDAQSLDQILSQRNMKTNIVTVDVHNGRRDSEQSFKKEDGGRALGVSTVSQSYHNMNPNAISVPVPVGDLGTVFGRISRPQSALSAYDISDIVCSSPEVGRKVEKKSPKTC